MKRNKLKRFFAVGLSAMVFLGGIQLTSTTVEASSWSRFKTASGYLKVTEGVTATASTEHSQGTSGDGGAVALVDGDPMTRYHSRYSGSPQPIYNSTDDEITANNEIELTLSEAKTLRGITYLPRQDARGNGVFKKFKVYVKLDGEADYSTDPVATVDWINAWPNDDWSTTNAPDEKEVTFDSVQDNVKQVKIVVTKTDAHGRVNGCIAGAEMGLVLNQTATYAEVIALVREGYEGGTVTGGGDTPIGGTATLTATPNEGYRFLHWVTVDGNVETIVSRDASITTKQIEETDTSLTYYAKFQKKLENPVNVALNKAVSSSDNIQLTKGALTEIVDGTRNTSASNENNMVKYSFSTTNSAGYIQVDLGCVYTNLDCVKLQRYCNSSYERQYGPTIIALSQDASFTNPVIIFNSNHSKNADGSDIEWAEDDKAVIDWSSAEYVGTENVYTETVEGREFQIPRGTKARYVRVYTAGKYVTKNAGWTDIAEQHIFELEVFASNVVPVDTITATAGSQETVSENGRVENVLDGRDNTGWHTKYNGGQDPAYKNWIDFEFDTPTIINGLKVQSRSNNNGCITGYQVWVSDKEGNLKSLDGLTDTGDAKTYTNTWQSEFTQVCSGTWPSNDGSVKTITFPEVTATHVRLVATVSTGNFAYIKKMCALTPLDSSEKQTFLGSALRMDYANNYEVASLRFMYEVPKQWNDWTLDETNLWGWKYSTNPENLNSASVTPVSEGKYTSDDENRVYKSNLVFTNIARVNYGRSIYAQLVVNYQKDGDTFAVYTPVAERSVYFVADAIVKAYSGDSNKEAQVNYAKGIMGPVSAQLATGVNAFNGEKVNIGNCLYTFTSTGTDNQYVISAKPVNGTKVYFNLDSGTTPNSTVSHNVTVSSRNSAFILHDDNENKYLHIYNGSAADTKKYTYDRCGTEGNDSLHEFALYKPSINAPEDSLIPGYDKVTDLSGITSGGKYLIVKVFTVNDVTTCYIMNPYSGGSNYNYVAKVVSND